MPFTTKECQPCQPDLSLPDDFSILKVSADSKRKGYRTIAALNQHWQLQVFITPPGICILDSDSYSKSRSMIFMQCTNANKSSVGHVCLGRYLNTTKYISGLHVSGIVDDFFLCIQQGVFVRDNQLYVVFHQLIPPKIDITLSDMIENCSNDKSSFVTNAFTAEHSVSNVADMEFVFLNQIAGPTLPGDKYTQSVVHVENDAFVEMRMNPDSWSNKYIHAATSNLPLLKSFSLQWKTGHSIKK